mmetsp:Transcript_37677/g.112456  ORF Transcript_37677/g.112456 Transcript_37677/m.112456 type:complete len:1111 (-) Transcript_37677:584-3916(-)
MNPCFIEACEAGTIERYTSLEAELLELAEYEIYELTEEAIALLHPPSDEARNNASSLRSHFQRYRDNIRFHSIAIKKYPVTFGGDKKLMLFLWRVPKEPSDRADADNDRTVMEVKNRLPVIHSRAVRREFTERFSHAVVSPSVLRQMYTLLTCDGSAPHDRAQRDVDERTLEYLVSGGDIELWPDMRVLNSGERDKYDLFWAAGDKVCASLVSCASDNRHGQERTLQQPISVPDFRRRVVEQLVADGHPDAAVPTDQWIAFQFMPRHPTRELATRHTGRWEISLKVLSTTLRKFNADAHACNALELNVKAFIEEADTVLVRAFEAQRDEVGAASDDQASHSGSDSDSGPASDGDSGRDSGNTIDYYLTSTNARTVRLSNDDKCKVPTGEPDCPVGTNVRPMAAALAARTVQLRAMDHSWHRASITPTVTLLTDLEHAFETNKWRNGQLVVTVKDSILQPSSAFRNAAELKTTILNQSAKPIIIDKRTDGGPEQNTTFLSVQLANVALLRATGADLLIHQRPAADTSWVNEVEGCMPLLNMALQHQATARLRMDERFETLLSNEGSMSKIREAIAAIEDPSERAAAKAAWTASVCGEGAPVKLLEQRFGRLEYTGRRVIIQPVETASAIEDMQDLVKEIDPNWESTMTTKAAVAKLPKLTSFLETHTVCDKYIVCIFNCGRAGDCPFDCPPLRMPLAAYKELIGDRLKSGCKIVPQPEHTPASGKEHFDTYENLKGRPTSEKHYPSYTPATRASSSATAADAATQKKAGAELWHATKARLTIGCSECGKPRCLFSLSALTAEQVDLAQSCIDDVSSYVCGATGLFLDDHVLASKLHIRAAITCGMPVEKQYYTSKRFRDCCTWCATTDPTEFADPGRLNLNGQKSYTICTRCALVDGKPVVTFGKQVKTAAKKVKAKGRKRQKVDSSEESEAEESEVEESEAETEADGEEASGVEEDDDEYQYTVELVLAKREARVARKGIIVEYAVKWDEWDQTPDMTWEPPENLSNAKEEVVKFERRVAAMPSRDAFSGPTASSACCYATCCKVADRADVETSQCFVRAQRWCTRPARRSTSSSSPSSRSSTPPTSALTARFWLPWWRSGRRLASLVRD